MTMVSEHGKSKCFNYIRFVLKPSTYALQSKCSNVNMQRERERELEKSWVLTLDLTYISYVKSRPASKQDYYDAYLPVQGVIDSLVS